MRVVIDTNCLLVAVPTHSPHKWLYEAFVEKQFEWAISNEIFREYEEKLIEFYGYRTALFVFKSLENAENVVPGSHRFAIGAQTVDFAKIQFTAFLLGSSFPLQQQRT